MLTSTYIFVLRLNRKEVSEGQIFLSIIEMVMTAVVLVTTLNH